MKAWNPKSESFDAVPPLPEFVGRWRIPGENEPRLGISSLLRRLARSVLRGAVTLVDHFDRTMEATPGSPSRPAPRPPHPPHPAPPFPADRVVLPMSSGINVKPGSSVQITSRPQSVAFRPERILIGGESEHWVVDEIKIGRHSQLTDSGCLPGAAFAADAEDVHVRLDVVETAMNFTMVVTYVGPEPEGAIFACAVLGNAALWEATPEGLEVRVGETGGPGGRIYLPLSSGVNILPGTSAQVKANLQDPFRVERILIGGDPDAWIVNDIKVGNRSQFSQKGDVPGAAFAKTARDSFISFETVQTAMDFTITVTYVGKKDEGEPLLACAIGRIPA